MKLESCNDEINFNEKIATCNMENFQISFLWITIALTIAVSIYCYLIKYRAKQKNSKPFNFKNSKLKEIIS